MKMTKMTRLLFSLLLVFFIMKTFIVLVLYAVTSLYKDHVDPIIAVCKIILMIIHNKFFLKKIK